MGDQLNPSPETASVIDSLPQAGTRAGSEPQGLRKRTYTRRRRKKTARRYVAAKETLKLNIPSSDEEPRSRMFLTTVANLLLLVAVLTIVFAAHRAVQNRQQVAGETIDHKPQTIDQTAQPTEETIDHRPKTIDQQQEAELTKPTEVIEQSEPTKPAKLAKPAKRSFDPYTNSGPLDLDRRENIGGKTQSFKGDSPPQKRGLSPFAGTDYRNPWNSGGPLDLDSEATRQQYKKALSLTE